MRCVFCEFVCGKRKEHSNGLPFMVIKKTKNTISFLSNVLPKDNDGHILVIPKKHYSSVSETPISVLKELIEHSSMLVKVLRKFNDGCNILLNDGKYAGQKVNHLHFHIIPRNKNDHILIEYYKIKKMSSSEFLGVHNKVKNMLN